MALLAGATFVTHARADDAARPPGPWAVFEARPEAPVARACSEARPVCVAVDRGASAASMLAALEAFERAWDAVTFALRLPAPDRDPDTLRYEVRLVHELAERAPDAYETVAYARDVRSRVDRASAFTRIDDRVRAGCTLDALAVRALVTASLLRASPATPDGVARAHATAFAMLAVPCSTALLADDVATFQSAAERAVCDARTADPAASTEGPAPVDRASARFASGAAIWWSRLDWAYGRQPGDVLRATWALAPTMTALAAPRWNDEPDAFDVLRKTFQGALSTGSSFADVALDVAVARAFVGTPAVGTHQPELGVFDASARVPVWEVPWPTQPRRLSPRLPVAPTGATYVAIATAGAPAAARLRVEIAWEEHALFRWALLRLDADGHELGRVVIPTQERAREAQMSLVEIDPARVARILLVGTNAGDPAYAFDPDEEVWEPHGALITIAAE